MAMRAAVMLRAVARILEELPGTDPVWAVLSDPGGCACLVPAVEALDARKRRVVRVLDGWADANLSPRASDIGLAAFLAQAEAARLPGVVLLGARTDFALTRRMLRACVGNGTRTFFFLDCWSHYERHFVGSETVLPDRILVSDDIAAAGLCEALARVLPDADLRDRVAITGHPGLEHDVSAIQAVSGEEADRVRNALGAVGRPLHLFLPTPLCQDYGLDQDDRSMFGYTEYTVLEWLLGKMADGDGVLAVKPHPRHDSAALGAFLARRDRTGRARLTGGLSLPALVRAADRVYGMNTVALLTALSAGKPVCSLQIGRNERGRRLAFPHLEPYAVSGQEACMKLAINGGKPVRTTPFPSSNTIGPEEKQAVAAVMDSGVLSHFLGCEHELFRGGPRVRALEDAWCSYFGVAHAVSVNSCTSGLLAALGAVGVGPGDEVIVPPYTMSATAVTPLFYGAVPVFADVDAGTYCLDPDAVKSRLTSRTRAIVVADIFGHPFDPGILALARERSIAVIEDTAQAPGARLNGRYAGVLADIGVYSLNYHKHIHCGEGGIAVTDDPVLAERLRRIRNHAESVAGPGDDLTNMVGLNLRMTELEAAVATEQLKRLEGFVTRRQENVRLLEGLLSGLPCLCPPEVRPGAEHAYYVHCPRYLEDAALPRSRFVAAVRAELAPIVGREAEGIMFGGGYVKPLYLLPLFQQRVAMGGGGWPFTNGGPDYAKGSCPVAERLHEHELLTNAYIYQTLTADDIRDVADAIVKVWEHRHELSGA